MNKILLDQYSLDDKLDFRDLHSPLLDIITKGGTPVTIGIFGSWGTGKTSLMRMLANETQKSSANRVVWFNAWKYDDEKSLWRAFILHVIDAIRPRDGNGNILPENLLVDYQLEMVEDLDRLEERLYRTVEWKELGELTLDWGKALSSTTKLAAQLAFLFIPGAAPFVKTLEKAQEMLAEGKPVEDIGIIASAFHRQIKEYRREQIRSLDQFEKEFGNVVSKYISKKNGRLIVFIDDLDRCLPEKGIEILEAIKLFLDVSGCAFIIGMDENAVKKGIAARYIQQNISKDDIENLGEKYLEKLIQVPFRLPSLSPDVLVSYIDSLIDEMNFDGEIPLSCRRIIAIGCPNNPRQVKRTINLFTILSKIADERFKRGKLRHNFSLPLLAKTVVIQTHFSEFYSDWVKFPTLIQQLEHILDFRRQVSDDDSSIPALPFEDSQNALLKKYSFHDGLYGLDLRLGELISYGDSAASDHAKDKERFRGLSTSEIASYFYLVQPGSVREVNLSQNEAIIWDDLLCGDLVKINSRSSQIIEAGSDITQSYRNRLSRIIHNENDTFLKRVSAGMALAYLGDTRDLNETVFIKPGEFKFGDQNEIVTIPDGFNIGKYPVTVSLFKKFVDSDGYKNKDYWTQDGWEWLQTWKIDRPKYWGDPRLNLSNYPITGISWYEASAYCRFVGGRLPTEKEWERTARSTDGREYPWMGEFSKDYANTSELSLGSICSVGLFAKGCSADGVLDLAGQVWEWTATEFDMSKYVLKGGAWGTNSNYAKSLYRFGQNPEVRDGYVGFRIIV